MVSNYPPGVTASTIERYFAEGPCEVCGQPVDNCLCHECPECGTIGDAECYEKHGLRLEIAQRIGHLSTTISELESNARETKLYLDHPESVGETRESIYRGLDAIHVEIDQHREEIKRLTQAQADGLTYIDELPA